MEDRALFGTLIAGLAFLPWIAEVAWQVRLQARFLDALPPDARAALGRHPRRSALAFLGGPRFELAVWRSFRRDTPNDDEAVRALKARMRASLRREIAWALGGLAIVFVLVRGGWRPWG